MAHEAVIREKLPKKSLEGAVDRSNVAFRKGVKETIDLVQLHKVPLLIFSAGIANIIEQVFLKKYGKLEETTHIISNWIHFDENDVIDSFSEPLIHMYNKNETHVAGHDYESSVTSRTNAILLGDGLGDGEFLLEFEIFNKHRRIIFLCLASYLVEMCNGLPEDATVLKVGFLNLKVEKLLPKYKEVYDVIVTNDGTFDYTLDLLNEIVANSSL